MTFFLGIDGGLGGAIALLRDDSIIKKWITPIYDSGEKREYDMRKILDILLEAAITAQHNDEKILYLLEKAQPTPIGGKMQMFSLGFSFGMFQGILISLRVPFQIVRARDWQKEVLRGLSASDTKEASILFASRRWPSEDWRATPRCKNLHDGLTDAANIAYYGYLTYGRKE